MTTDLDLTNYQALSFDCYASLIDWEAGIAAVLTPWVREQRLDLTDEQLLLAYADNEAAVERDTPSALYPRRWPPPSTGPGRRSDTGAQRLGICPGLAAFPDPHARPWPRPAKHRTCTHSPAATGGTVFSPPSSPPRVGAFKPV